MQYQLEKTRKMDSHNYAVRLTTAAITIFLLLVQPVSSDYETGLQAWESKRYREAVAEWMEAANAEDGRAMFALGRAYLDGIGVIRSFVEAHKWFNLASSYGLSEAIDERNALFERMTSDERSEAQSLAKQWQPHQPQSNTSNTVTEENTKLPSKSPSRETVRNVQSILAALGYHSGAIDGLWGPRTASAYHSFLADSNLPITDELTSSNISLMKQIADSSGISMPSQRQIESDQSNASATLQSGDSGTSGVLLRAAIAGDVAKLEAVLSSGANIDARDSSGLTALMHATINGYSDIARILVDSGANLNLRGPSDVTALFLAALQEDMAIAGMLFQAGADGSIPDSEGRTASDAARLMFGVPEKVIEKGMPAAIAGLSAGLTWNETLEWIDEAGQFEKILGRPPSAESIDENGWTDLHWASIMDMPKVANVLLKSGAIVDQEMKFDSKYLSSKLRKKLKKIVPQIKWIAWKRDGDTPLRISATVNSTAVARVLLDHGADVNESNKFGSVPLHRTAWYNATAMMNLLIERGGLIDAKNKYGGTPLHWAAWQDSSEAAKLLIAHGADINIGNNQGDTPLHYAAKQNSTEVAKILLTHGARIDKENDAGFVPLMTARFNRKHSMVNLLKNAE